MRKTLATFVVLAIILVAFFVIIEWSVDNGSAANQTEDTPVSFKPDGEVEQLSSYDTRRLDKQKELEKQLQEEYIADGYSLAQPFVKVDPYGVAPLTAVAKFQTDEPVKITVTVEGKGEKGAIERTYDEWKTEHTVPVLGLYPDYENTVTIKATNEAGETATKSFTAKTDALPDDFLTNEVVEAKPDKMENGLTFILPSSRYVYAVDDKGEVRWYSTLWNSHIFKRFENGNLMFITKEKGQDKYNEILEMDMLGKVYNAYTLQMEEHPRTNVVHHDIIELPNGNLLATVHDLESDYVQDEMIEIDRKTGETVRDFSFRDIFPESFYEEYDGLQADKNDWFHQNAIWYVEEDDSILVSSRHQDLVMKMSYPEGEVDWILADHEEWPKSYDKYLLDPQGDDFKFPAGPHAPMTMPDMDNNSSTNDYLLFDNNIVITRGKDPLSEQFSRAIQYRINPEKMTVEEVWAYGEERGKDLFSNIVGDANYYPETGNRMLTSGYIDVGGDERISRVVEVSDDQPAEVIYELVVSGFEQKSHRQAYRALRLPLYPEQEWNVTIGE
ncbi:aryl-sulfate sulfotransferase [Lentibacillus cibarius]|uniref:Aryl-sulfate sulfotransferase n=1 Tax=Lentibacillus cibarius TaxID=2583219 RepID=A0A5S3R7N1_9BACI|nr:aryl-sulfate sulfotransferase [Lentibacillus cibarius]TMN22113.1 aryl-sulfate sulfotransferase [Lentibacillus cibarius]